MAIKRQTRAAYGCLVASQSPSFFSCTPALSVTQQRRCSCATRLVALCNCYMPSAIVWSTESCDETKNLTMCPLCSVRCGYWNYHDSCVYVQLTRAFDNELTFFFAIFMSLWGQCASGGSNNFLEGGGESGNPTRTEGVLAYGKVLCICE